MNYQPTLDSLQTHSVPDWYHDAKLGIFVHWGPYSVPAWAPTFGDMDRVVADHGWEAFFRNNPYAEWYLHSMQFPGSPTQQHHQQVYGTDYPYDRFADTFRDESSAWNPAEWVTLFQSAGARYVVLTTRHCDSFALWPTQVTHPDKGRYATSRDLVGDLTSAVRDAGLRMGLYYCGGMDWTFTEDFLVREQADVMGKMAQSAAYNDYINAQWRELIARYRPDILWNDIGWPRDSDPLALMAEYYNAVPEGLVNDRFAQHAAPMEDGIIANPRSAHFDIRTPEYTSFADIQAQKWETCRGIGHSFGYNQQEDEANYIAPSELIRLFVDIVSKNGNLLLNVGPAANGSIHPAQQERLQALGAWLAVNGEAIYGTRPWSRAEGKTADGAAVRFTQTRDALYIIVLDRPAGPHVTVLGADVLPADGARVTLLGHDAPLDWIRHDDRLEVILPVGIPWDSPLTLKLSR